MYIINKYNKNIAKEKPVLQRCWLNKLNPLLEVGGPSRWDFKNFDPLNVGIKHPKEMERERERERAPWTSNSYLGRPAALGLK